MAIETAEDSTEFTRRGISDCRTTHSAAHRINGDNDALDHGP